MMDQRWSKSVALKENLVGDELAGPQVSLVQQWGSSSEGVELGGR